MKTSEQKKKEALERNAEHSKLTTAQKLLKLDITFGEGKGASKERAKLALAALEDEKAKATVQKTEAKKDKKPYQKPKKS